MLILRWAMYFESLSRVKCRTSLTWCNSLVEQICVQLLDEIIEILNIAKSNVVLLEVHVSLTCNSIGSLWQLKATGGVRGQKNMLILFERFYWCGVNAFYRMSKFYSVQKLLVFRCIGLWLFYSNFRGHFGHILYLIWL